MKKFLLILLSIIDKLIDSIDIDILNSRFKRLFYVLSYNVDINDVIEPILPKLKVHAEDIINRVKEKYNKKEGEYRWIEKKF